MLRCCNLKVFKTDLTQHLADLEHTMGNSHSLTHSLSRLPPSLPPTLLPPLTLHSLPFPSICPLPSLCLLSLHTFPFFLFLPPLIVPPFSPPHFNSTNDQYIAHSFFLYRLPCQHSVYTNRPVHISGCVVFTNVYCCPTLPFLDELKKEGLMEGENIDTSMLYDEVRNVMILLYTFVCLCTHFAWL